MPNVFPITLEAKGARETGVRRSPDFPFSSSFFSALFPPLIFFENFSNHKVSSS